MSNLEGAILGDYLLLECISRGSVADVYRARQNDAGQYEVAVKIFRPGYAERESFRAYFLREAEKIGQFDHPHILPFMEYGEGDGLLYAVTPFVKSGTLDDLLKKVGGKFSAMQAQPVVQQLCDAVQYAHDHDVVHGNIKPRNIFVANDGRMLLADFGIVRGYADGQQALTRPDWSSTQYAAPEQSLGLLRRSSDVYSLGAIFFRLLTGSPVFVGQTPIEVLLKHVREMPPLARSLEPGISDPVDEVLQKALSKRADDRYRSVSELEQAFVAAVAIAPVASPVARTIVATTRPLVFDTRSSVPAFVAELAELPTAPIMAAVASRVDALSPLPPASELIQQSTPQPAVLPEQHGLSGLSRLDVPRSPQSPQPEPSAYWSHAPVEWSPLTGIQSEAQHIPAYADDYLRGQPPEVQEEPVEGKKAARKTGRLLPVLVLILLLAGLLAALLSSFFLPPVPSRGAWQRAAPVVVLAQTSVLLTQRGG